MKLFIFYLSLLTVGGFCKIDEPCTVLSNRIGRSKPLTGTYQKRGECIKSGHAAFSKSEPVTELRLSDDKDSSDKEDESIQCCVEITCGDNGKCRNNIEGNPCTKGYYLPNLNRARKLCPASTSDDNVQCCSEQIDHNTHIGLRIRGILSPRYCSQTDSMSPDMGSDPDCWGAQGLMGTQSVGTGSGAVALTPSDTSQSGVGLVSSPGGSLPTFNAAGNSFSTPGSTPAPALDAFAPQAPDPQVPTTITTTPAPAPISNVAFNSLSNDATSHVSDTPANTVPDNRSKFDINSNAIVSANHFDNVGRPLGPTGPPSSGIIAGVNPGTGLAQVGGNFGNFGLSVSPLKSFNNVVGNLGSAFSNGAIVNANVNFRRR